MEEDKKTELILKTLLVIDEKFRKLDEKFDNINKKLEELKK